MSITDDRYNTTEAAEIRLVIEKFCGIFKFSSNVKLFCNFCQNELVDHRAECVEKHLKSVEHLEKGFKYKRASLNQNIKKGTQRKSGSEKNRCFSLQTNELVFVSDDEDVDNPESNKVNVVMKAFSEGVYINQKFDKIHCVQCQVDIYDSFLLLKKHLKNKEHVKKMLKTCSDKAREFIKKNPCLELDGYLVHCKPCNKKIQAKIFNLKRHCSRTYHQKALKSNIDSGDDRFAKRIQINKHELKKLNKFDSSMCLEVKEGNEMEETNDDSATDNSDGDDQNLKTAAEQLIKLEKIQLQRLMLENNCLVFYNQPDKVLCKPCENFMTGQYMIVKNHLQRQSHKDNFEQFQKAKNELTTAIVMIPNTNEEQSQIIVIEEEEVCHDKLIESIDHSSVVSNDKNIEQQQVDKPTTALDDFFQMNIEI